jgi:two-component system nitrate/nitrite response regulator NarP
MPAVARSPSPGGDEPIAVLICDDIEAMRKLLRIVVELDPGFRVAGEAGSGDEAVAQARELQPDVILLDLSMPGRTGLVALPEIRLVAPASAVIAFSGLDESVVADAARAAGADLFLQKGARPEAILAAIEAVHRKGRGGGQVAPAQNGGYETAQDVQQLAPGQPA